jgi:hypothetical protein
MSIQQTVHISLSIQFYHSTRSFQFINTCNEHEKPFVLLPQKNYTIYPLHQKTFIVNH